MNEGDNTIPYIKQKDRPRFEALLREFDQVLSREPFLLSLGDFNYIFTHILHQALKRWGVKYVNINALIGVLECCKLELYRRIAAPYEDQKIKENGDVS